MSANPSLIKLSKAEYKIALGGKKTWYMKIGVLPRAFYDYSTDTIFYYKYNRKLLCHEYAHSIDYVLSDHPDTLGGFIRHSFAVKFDCRTAVGPLRLRFGPADLVSRFESWEVTNDLKAS